MLAAGLQASPLVLQSARSQVSQQYVQHPASILRRSHCTRAQASDSDSAHDSVQDGLVSILHLEIMRKRMRELSDSERQAFVDKAKDEMQEDLQQLQASAAARSAKDFENLLSSLTSSVDELSRALDASKEETKAGQLEFEEWKQDMAKRRSESLFFKALYREKKGKPKRLVDSLDVFTYPKVTDVRERLAARAQTGSEDQQAQFQRNLAYIYAATSAVLFIGAVDGIRQTGADGRWQTALYGIFALAFGASSWLSLQKLGKRQ